MRGLRQALVVAALAGSAWAEPASEQPRAVVAPAGTVLSLEAFVEQVLAAHPVARSAELERDVAAAEVQAARGGFDPLLKTKVDNKSKDGRDKTNRVDSELEFPIGAMFGPRVIAGYRRDVGTNTNPEDRTDDDGEASLGISVQLLQGIFTDRRRAALAKAGLRPELSEAIRLQERNNLARAAAVEYWDWAEAREQLDVQLELLAVAEDRARQVGRRADAGEAAPIDAVEAEQEVARRRGEALKARRTYEQNAIDASVYLWNGDGTPLALDGQPQRIPDPAAQAAGEIARARAEARELRPEVQRARLAQEAAKIDVKLSRELRRPNLEARVESIQDDVGSPSGSQYKLGFTLSHPLLFRTPDAQLDLARIAEHRAALARIHAERVVQADVENALSGLARALERIRAGESETTLANRMADGERTRFAAGESSLLVVNLRERAAAEARSRLVNAKADYVRAIVGYRWAVGTLAADGAVTEAAAVPPAGRPPG